MRLILWLMVLGGCLLMAGCEDEPELRSEADEQPTAVSDADGNAEAVPVAIDNKMCPIMDSPVSSAIETRSYKGHTIGFCCAGCPDQWDALSEEEKDARLARMNLEPQAEATQ